MDGIPRTSSHFCWKNGFREWNFPKSIVLVQLNARILMCYQYCLLYHLLNQQRILQIFNDIHLASLEFAHLFSWIPQPRMHQSSKSLCVAIFKRRSWGFQNTPNLWDLEHFKPSYGHLKKIKVSKNNFDWQFCSKSLIISKHLFFQNAITWLKIIQTLQVGGVLESSWAPLDDGHRDFEHRCILGWVIHERQVSKF